MSEASVRGDHRSVAISPHSLQLPERVRRVFRCVLSQQTEPHQAPVLLCSRRDVARVRAQLLPLLPATLAVRTVPEPALERALSRLAREDIGLGEEAGSSEVHASSPGVEDGDQTSGGSGVIDLDARPSGAAAQALTAILNAAIGARASDIHLVPDGTGYALHLRIHGRMSPPSRMDRERGASIIRRLKYLAAGAVLEPQRPGDYSLTCRRTGDAGNGGFRVRLATIPTPNGEAASLRLFSGETFSAMPAGLGFDGAAAGIIEAACGAPSGLFLVAGAMGAGKSTTLRSVLLSRARSGSRCIALEDPVEIPVPGVLHVSMRPGAERVEELLRHIVRHDPDVIMIGEIRDPDSVVLARELALLGRLVLATLHAESIGAVPARLADLGEPWERIRPRLVVCLHQTLLPLAGPHGGRAPICTAMPGPLGPPGIAELSLSEALRLAHEDGRFCPAELEQLRAWGTT